MSEECLAGAPVTTEQSSVKWRVPFRMRKTTRNFEVRLGPPGGDKVSGENVGQNVNVNFRATKQLLEWILHSSICVGGSTT